MVIHVPTGLIVKHVPEGRAGPFGGVFSGLYATIVGDATTLGGWRMISPRSASRGGLSTIQLHFHEALGLYVGPEGPWAEW